MANVRVVSFASEGETSKNDPFTFFYRLNTGKKWLSRGISKTTDLERTITAVIDETCSLPTRTILRTDDGSGAEISISGIVRVIERETVLGSGRLKFLHMVVYPKNPIPSESVTEAEAAVEATLKRERTKCCVVQ